MIAKHLLDEAYHTKLITEAEYRRMLEPDPLEHLTLEQRWDWAVAHAASGAPAECPPPGVDVNGTVIPAPPGHRGRRSRSPRGKSPAPPDRALCGPESEARDDGGTGVRTPQNAD